MQQDWLDREFAESSSKLVDLILPNAAPEQRVTVLSALAAFAVNIKHQTVHHMSTEQLRAAQ